jgi:hypothetical protein
MRTTRALSVLVVAAALLGGGRAAFAQPRRPAPPSDPPESGEAAPGARTIRERKTLRREQIKKKIRAMRAYTLTEELALDEATAARLFPVLARYDDEIDKLLERRVEIQRKLRRADTVRDPRAIDRTIDDAVANQRSFSELEDRRIAELRKILTPVQTARLLIVLPALERKIENQLRQAIVGRRGGGAGGAGGAADDDDDRQPDEVAPARQPRVLRRREAPLAAPAGGSPPSNAPGNTPPCTPNTESCR